MLRVVQSRCRGVGRGLTRRNESRQAENWGKELCKGWRKGQRGRDGTEGQRDSGTEGRRGGGEETEGSEEYVACG